MSQTLMNLSNPYIGERRSLISQSTVSQYLTDAEAAGLQWPLPEDWDDGEIERKLNPHRPALVVWRKHDEPDWPAIHRIGERRPGSAGLPLPGASVRNPDADGNPLPDGATGEQYLRGPNLFAGYWRREEATAATVSHH